jgi:hypothetical protein
VALVLFQRRPVEQRPPPAALATAAELDH